MLGVMLLSCHAAACLGGVALLESDMFRFNTTGLFYSIAGTVEYEGGQMGEFRVLAADSAGSWASDYSVAVPVTGAYKLVDLPPGTTYWLRAFVDRDYNGIHTADEDWGDYQAGSGIMLNGNRSDVAISILPEPALGAAWLLLWCLVLKANHDTTKGGRP